MSFVPLTSGARGGPPVPSIDGMLSNDGRFRIRVRTAASSFVARAQPPGLRWPIAVRLLIVCVLALLLVRDPKSLAWGERLFWAAMLVVTVAFFVHTLRLARTRSRLRLDLDTAKLTSSTLGGSAKHVCALDRFQLGSVALLESDDGEDGAETYCLHLGFGSEQVRSFVGHDESELLELHGQVANWLRARSHRGLTT